MGVDSISEVSHQPLWASETFVTHACLRLGHSLLLYLATTRILTQPSVWDGFSPQGLVRPTRQQRRIVGLLFGEATPPLVLLSGPSIRLKQHVLVDSYPFLLVTGQGGLLASLRLEQGGGA